MRMLLATAGAASLWLISAAPAFAPAMAQVTESSNLKWVLTWSDEFDGNAIDRTKWTVEESAKTYEGLGDSNFVDTPETSRVSDGMLKIYAFPGERGRWDTAKLHTQGHASWKYGRFETRMKVPSGVGVWPAFWMFPDTPTWEKWPEQGEMDIMEHVGSQPHMVQAVTHYLDRRRKHAFTVAERNTILPVAAEWHTYALEWTPRTFSWFMDGKKYLETTSDPNGNGFPFNRPFFLIVNLSIGGRWAGHPAPGTKFPDPLQVDYVRVFRDSTLPLPKTRKAAAAHSTTAK